MFFLCPILSLSLSVADVHIQQVVPDTTIAVVSTGNIAQVIQHMNESGLSESLSACYVSIFDDKGADFSTSYSEEFQQFCDSLGIDYKNWSPPEGHAGFAVYPVVDYELGTVGLGAFGMIELQEELYESLFNGA